MVSFRFHLVSITAVFLALALGIAMGATVVDRATVDLLERRLDTVRTESERTDKENAELRGEVDRWNQFSAQAGDRLVANRLTGVPVVAVLVEGGDRAAFDALRQTIVASGANLLATVVLTAKLALRNDDDVAELRQVADAASARPPDLRRIVASQVAAALTAPHAAEPLGVLVDRGFARIEGASGGRDAVSGLAAPGARYVVAAGAESAAPNGELALPLVDQLAEGAPPRVLAAEAGREAERQEPQARAAFVAPLRARDEARVSTVDHLDAFAGRVAAVLALQAMNESRVGHYGMGPGASRLLPEG